MAGEDGSGTVAVLDIGKTNVKLNATTAAGAVLETLSVENPVRDGPPWRYHDLAALRAWALEGLAALCRRHRLRTFVCSGHGSGGVLVLADPDEGDGTALPMIDYEQPLPENIAQGYAPLSGSFFDRGSATMGGATHQARQLYWMQRAEPERFARARWFLGIPQYWAWVLSGVAVSETTTLAAQSHLWNVAEKRWAPVVAARGWQNLLPDFASAWQEIGAIRPELARRYGLPTDLRILAGGHDSSLNYYRYQAAGMADAAVLSTGTWIVGLSGATPLDRLDENRGMTLNSDVFGRPLGGVLSMGGREFSAIAGREAPSGTVGADSIGRIVERGTMALPTFGAHDGLFPGTSGKGRIAGEPPHSPGEAKALAVIYCALLTAECIAALGDTGEVVLDGSFLREPAYASLVAAFVPQRRIRFNLDAYGVASGAALLAEHGTRSRPAPVELTSPARLDAQIPGLAAYAAAWRRAAGQGIS